MDYGDIENMTNQQAAEILKMQMEVRCMAVGRGNGKTFTNMCILKAMCKAIELLENTPDA